MYNYALTYALSEIENLRYITKKRTYSYFDGFKYVHKINQKMYVLFWLTTYILISIRTLR